MSKKKNHWFQAWNDDWNTITKDFPLKAKGLFREMEGWAVTGKPYGHVTWPNGDPRTVAEMATATGQTPEDIAEIIKLIERVEAIGLSKSKAYVMHHLIKRHETSKKRAKSGKNGGSVSASKIREKSSLLEQMPKQVLKPINEKRELNKKEKQEKEKNPPWFTGGVIRLNQRDYEAWRKRYPGNEEQFEKWLSSRDDWMTAQAPEIRKNWFISTARAIENLENA